MRLTILLALLVAASAVSCERPSRPLVAKDFRLVVPDGERLDLVVELPGGEVRLDVGEGDAVSAHFDYDHPAMEPRVDVLPVAGGRRLRLAAPGWHTGIGPTTNLWRVRLPSRHQAALTLRVGAGRVAIDEAPPRTAAVGVEMNFGEVTLDLRAVRPEGTLPVTVRVGNASRTAVVLPDDLALRVRAHKSVGTLDVGGLRAVDDETWTNAAFDEGRVPAVDLSLLSAVGEIEVRAVPRSGDGG